MKPIQVGEGAVKESTVGSKINLLLGYFLPRHSHLDIDGIGNSRTVGACCFRWREWVDAPHGWALQWILLHPYFRHQGILSNAWSLFTQRFGSFHVEEPLSEAMHNFLFKIKAN